MEVLNKIEPKSFDVNWWNTFFSSTNNLSQTAVLKNCVHRDETAALRENVLQIIRDLAKLRTKIFGYRVYVDGLLLDNNGMNRMYDTPPLPDEDLEKWTERVFGDKKFGMIINCGEKFNLALSKNLALKVSPLFDKIGFPWEGINFSLFIGNYDKTPLGIHRDKKGENVMHFHLGPGPKTMYTWSTPLYESLMVETRGNNNNLDALLEYATEYSFEEGDLYYMPEGEYHIGKQNGLSMAVTLWQYNHPKDQIVKKLQSILFNQFFEEGKDNSLKPDHHALEDISALDTVLECFRIPEDLDSFSYKELMEEAYKDLKYSIYSNAGYRTSPFPKDDDTTFSPAEYIEIETPYVIRFKESVNREKLHIYVRGVKLELNNYPCIKALIEAINLGDPILVSELKLTLDPNWDYEILSYILNLLYKNHGIKKSNTL